MATEVRTTSTSTPNVNKQLKGKSPRGKGPVLDEEGNVLPYSGYSIKKEIYCQPSPIPRLAEAASLTKPIPTAGDYAIELSKEPQPDLNIPPECYLYDEDRPWVLGKLNKAALDYPEPAEPVPLPKHTQDLLDALECAANAVAKARSSEASETDAATQDAANNNSSELYAKEKTVALTALLVLAKESKAKSDQIPVKPTESKAELDPKPKPAKSAEFKGESDPTDPKPKAAKSKSKSPKAKARKASPSPVAAAMKKLGLRPGTARKSKSPSPKVSSSTAAPAPVQTKKSPSSSSSRVVGTQQPQQPKPTAQGKSPVQGKAAPAPPAKVAPATGRSSTASKKVSNAK